MQEEHLPHPSRGFRGSVYYCDFNLYDPKENSPYLSSNSWDEKDDSPSTNTKNPMYPTNTPYPKETVPSNEEDPIDPTGDEPFPGQSRWSTKESSFPEDPTVRHMKVSNIPQINQRNTFPIP